MEANSSIEQEPRRPGKPAPKALESGRIHRPKKVTERLPPNTSQVEVTIPTRRKNKPTLRKPRSPSRDLGSREKTDRFSILCFPKSEGRHHRRNGEWPTKRRRGTTGLTVPMTRNGQEPEPSHNLQENSRARFLSTRQNHSEDKSAGAKPERTPTGNREGEAKEDLHKPAEKPHKGKSRRSQD